MGRGDAHPHREEAIAWVLAHPEESHATVAERFGVDKAKLAVWMFRARKKMGSNTVPRRAPVHEKGTSKVVALAPPAAPPPPRVAPADIASEFRTAALNSAKRIRELSASKDLSLKDAVQIIELTTGTFSLLHSFDADAVDGGDAEFIRRLRGDS